MSTPEGLPRDVTDLFSDTAAPDERLGHLTTALYLQCARLSRFHVRDLDPGDASTEDLQRALAVLAARGLISQRDEDTWLTNPPDTALADQASRLEEHAATIRAAAPGLARIYYDARARARPGDRDVGVELLDSLDDVNTAMAELFSGARRRVFSMRTRSPRVLSMMESSPERHAGPVLNRARETLSLRVTFDTVLLDEHQGLPDAIARRMRMDDIRFATNVPFTATASDTGITVMDLQDQTAGSVGVRITHPDVSAAIRRVIDNTWAHGMKWTGPGTSESRGPSPLDQRDREILALMVSGAADAAIARQVGISQRTVERRVRRLLDLAGAGTRFQAGVQAARRGWV